MMCPNKNHPDWKALEATYGSTQAFRYWMAGLDSQSKVDNYIKSKDEETPIKEGVSELFDSNPELAKLGTQEQYSQYLDTIFPDSKVKDIVYHGTRFQFNKFDKSFIGKQTQSFAENLFYFVKDKKSADEYAKYYGLEDGEYEAFEYVQKNNVDVNNPSDKAVKYFKEKYGLYDKEEVSEFLIQNQKNIGNPRVIPVVLNIKNPNTTSYGLKNDEDGIIRLNEVDNATSSLKETDVYGVKQPEQIHILGSKQDIEGFKEFVSEDTTQPEVEDPTKYKKIYKGSELTKPTNPNNEMSLEGFKEGQKGVYEVFEENRELLEQNGITAEMLVKSISRNKNSILDIENWINNCLRGRAPRSTGDTLSFTPKAEQGMKSSKFTKGGTWKIIKDLQGYPTHEKGGVDLMIGKDGVSITSGQSNFKAEYGLVLPYNTKNYV